MRPVLERAGEDFSQQRDSKGASAQQRGLARAGEAEEKALVDRSKLRAGALPDSGRSR
jgi:hypothetical protein